MKLLELRPQLVAAADPEFAVWQTNYLRNQFSFLGVKVPVLRKIVQKLPDSENWRAEVKELWAEKEREFHLGAIYHAIRHRKMGTQRDLPLFEEMIVTHSWWDTVDTIAPHLIGFLFHKFPELLPVSQKWLQSPHLWLRRTALIYRLFNRKKMDPKSLFHACRSLHEDPDFFIRKAIGWVLREHSKTHPEQVTEFLNITPLSPLSLREASKYL